MCYHAVRARDWYKAFVHGKSAGRKCLSRSAFSDAANYFEVAMGALDKTPMTALREADAIDLRMEARAAFIASGQVAEWLDLGKEAERRVDAIDDIGRKVAAMTVRAGAQSFYGAPVEAIAVSEEVVRLAEGMGQSGLAQSCAIRSRAGVFPCRPLPRSRADIGTGSRPAGGPNPSAPIGTTPRYLSSPDLRSPGVR